MISVDASDTDMIFASARSGPWSRLSLRRLSVCTLARSAVHKICTSKLTATKALATKCIATTHSAKPKAQTGANLRLKRQKSGISARADHKSRQFLSSGTTSKAKGQADE